MKELILLIMNQTTILFENIEETIDAIDETQLGKDGSWEWPLGEQVYHLLHSLDQWFINPYDYEEPTFTEMGTGSSDGKINRKLSKLELVAYYASIKAKITRYLCTLDDHSLKECPKNCRFTRLDLILGQYRHAMYHIGLVHGCLRSETRKSPEFIGLSSPIVPVHTR